jgi:hypothetical protein
MEWPIVQKSQTLATPVQVEQAGLPAGIDHSRGEGGFYGRIVFQDTSKPWRYAFVQAYRLFDPTDLDVYFFESGPGQQTQRGRQFDAPGGESSLWNESAGNPFLNVKTAEGKNAVIPEGRVVNWAEETNRVQSVPIGAWIWVRGGEDYAEPDMKTPRHDYTFTWSWPIYAKIVGRHFVSAGDNTPNNQYQWIEQRRERDPNDPQKIKWSDAIEYRHSTLTPFLAGPVIGPINSPAREINGNIAVPAGPNIHPYDANYGAIVVLYPGQVIEYDALGKIVDQEWLFSYEGGPTYGNYEISGGVNNSQIISSAANNLTVAVNTQTANIAQVARTVELRRTGAYAVVWTCSVKGRIAQGDLTGLASTLRAAVSVDIPYASGFKIVLIQDGNPHSVSEGNWGACDTIEANDGYSGNAVITTIVQVSGAVLPSVLTFDVEATGANASHFAINDSQIIIIRIDDAGNR